MQGVRVSLKVTQSRYPRRGPILMILLLGLLAVGHLQAETYDTHEALAARLTGLEGKGSDVLQLHLLARSLAGRKVWLAELGIGTDDERKTRPAVLVLAGVEGNDVAGSVLVCSWIERLLEARGTDPNIARLLETTTVYAVPRLNPDGAEDYFETPRRETLVNGRPHDDDHDALVDEDGPEDLNGDGVITSMRVRDREGRYILDPQEDRLLIEADPMRGEVGRWRLLSEGIDNDHDERWNEDGTGGVNFARNFPYDYDFFAPDAGVHPVCEAETRALADFVVSHPNIGIVLTYGMADNLLKALEEAKKDPGRGEPLTAIDSNDAPLYRAFGKLYRDTLGLDTELEGASQRGTFSDWMYFHRGRLSLAARPWSPKLAMALTKDDEDRDTEAEADQSEKQANREKKKDEDKRGQEEREQLEWFDEHAPDAFRAWQAFDHPDFPGQRVEIGGYAPFALTNPLEGWPEDLVAAHGRFLTELLNRLPRLALRRVECAHLGESVYEIEIRVENTGFLPTVLAHGERTREVNPTRVALDVQREQILSGTRLVYLPAIEGSGGVAKARWTVYAPDQSEIGFRVVSMLAGTVEGVIDLTDAPMYAKQAGSVRATRDDDPR